LSSHFGYGIMLDAKAKGIWVGAGAAVRGAVFVSNRNKAKEKMRVNLQALIAWLCPQFACACCVKIA